MLTSNPLHTALMSSSSRPRYSHGAIRHKEGSSRWRVMNFLSSGAVLDCAAGTVE